MDVKQERERFDSYYESFLGAKIFRWLDWKKIQIIKEELSRLGDGLDVLDLGCGSAGISSSLKKALPSMNVIGADHNSNLLEKAGSRGIKTKLVDFDRPLPFDDNRFNVILMIDTIEHVECRKDSINQVKRILKSDGTLIIFTPPYDTITWRIGEFIHGILTRRATDHISPFTKESLTWFLNNSFYSCEIGRTNFGLTMYGIAQGKK